MTVWLEYFVEDHECTECGCTMHLNDTGDVPLRECTFCGHSEAVPVTVYEEEEPECE
jgi:Zn ribbon nucleic-acid-binding protein